MDGVGSNRRVANIRETLHQLLLRHSVVLEKQDVRGVTIALKIKPDGAVRAALLNIESELPIAQNSLDSSV